MGQRLLEKLIPRKQDGTYTCWAACTRAIYQMYTGTDPFENDAALASACGLSVEKCQNIQIALEKYNLYDGQDDTANLPTMQEIVASINKGEPLAVCVTRSKVSFTQDVSDGHYILIVGYNDETNQLAIMDPAASTGGRIEWIPYNDSGYHAPYGDWFWACTYYTTQP